ncbi:MAG: hypothetical protein IPN05_19875 [Sulfuritalea sp.]|nr:hypothetical protein [Sulfuritalea sp.]
MSVAAPDEDVYLNNSTVSRSITGATGGNFESLAASTVAASTSITDTIGTTTVSLTADPDDRRGRQHHLHPRAWAPRRTGDVL